MMSDGQIAMLFMMLTFLISALACYLIEAVDISRNNKKLQHQNEKLARQLTEEKEKQKFLNSIR